MGGSVAPNWLAFQEPHPSLEGHTGYRIRLQDGSVVCEIFTRSNVAVHVSRQYARLIAAAPDLYTIAEKQLKFVESILPDLPEGVRQKVGWAWAPLFDEAVIALTKASGEDFHV